MTDALTTPVSEAGVQPVKLKTSRTYSAQAIRCVRDQQYPIVPDVWPEALDLISRLCGVDLRERSHDLVMGDAKALSLTAAASEELKAQLKRKFTDSAERDALLGRDSAMFMAIDTVEQLAPYDGAEATPPTND